MKAIRIHEFGGPEVLRVEDLPIPEPGPGEVLVRVRASSVNPVDYKIRNGGYLPASQLPITMGRDMAGVVEAVGTGATLFEPGAEVYALLARDKGGNAEYVTSKAGDCAAKPKRLDFIQAAAVPLAALTAWQGIFDHGGLKAGQTVLIHGAGGGVGHLAVQLAHAHGARVIATASGQDLDFLKSLGADEVVDYHNQRFENVAYDVDLVYDLIGKDTQTRSWAVLREGGVLVSTVQEPDQAKAAEKNARALRYMAEANGVELGEIGRLIDAGKVTPTIARTFPLAETADAERALEDGHVRGKIVLEVN